MNRLFIFTLCSAALLSASAQKAVVNQAKKLQGKTEQLGEARNLIKQAMQNPETQNDANTYFVAGMIELDAFDNAYKTKMINPNAPEADGVVMSDELMNAYNYFTQALPLDSLPNEKGQVKPQVSGKIIDKVASHASDFFTAGAEYFNAQKYYPEAYEAFMLYGDLPSSPLYGKKVTVADPQQTATAYFNAGLAAYQGQQLEASAKAFEKARLAGYEQPEAYIYEIACYQTMMQQDESRAPEAEAKIYETAQAGNEKFGLEQPIFINNMINSMVSKGNVDEALAQLSEVIAANPEMPSLYGLRGYVYDRADKDAESEADYRKAASLPGVDFETLKNASKKLFRVGTQKLNDVEGASAEANAARQDIKQNYFVAAQQIAQQADNMNPGDSDLQNVLESIDYALTTFFNN